MKPDTRMEDAVRRMTMRPPVILENEGQLNDDPNLLGQYPRMLYRATEAEQREVQPGAESFDDKEVADKSRVINDFGGLLCDTIIAVTADEAEVLASEGWDITPQAAHGQEIGLVAVTTAKDDEIARLRAEIEQLTAPPAKTGRVKADAEPIA